MKVVQITERLSHGDAISDHVFAIDGILRTEGFDCAVMSVFADGTTAEKSVRYDAAKASEADVALLHFAAYTPLVRSFCRLRCRKAIVYHNITPPKFFKGYGILAEIRTTFGRRQVKSLAKCCEAAFCVSEFNRGDLVACGFDARKALVTPLIVDLRRYDGQCDENFLARFRGEAGTKLLFTGRLAPNKKIEDVVKVFYYYKTFVDPQSQLFLVGSHTLAKYYAQLSGFVAALGIGDVHFCDHIPFRQLLSCFRAADVFVCMSEHEGFCVPLVEAMHCKVPIVAFNSSAIGETLGGAGVLLDKKDFIAAAEEIRLIMSDSRRREKILDAQSARLRELSFENTKAAFLDAFRKFAAREI